jgi:hypothetical protein
VTAPPLLADHVTVALQPSRHLADVPMQDVHPGSWTCGRV